MPSRMHGQGHHHLQVLHGLRRGSANTQIKSQIYQTRPLSTITYWGNAREPVIQLGKEVLHVR